MKTIEVDDAGTHVVVGDPGDDAVGLLTEFARDHGITSGQFSAVGSFQRATVGWFDRDVQDYQRIEIDEPCQVLSLLGDIVPGADGPQVHAQVVLGLSDGTTRGGHLLAGAVWPTLEVVLHETTGQLRKTIRPGTGLALIDPELITLTEAPSGATVGRVAPARGWTIAAGIALILLGSWGALAPFFAPSFQFGFTPDQTWRWSPARGWLEVLPGCVAVVGGLVMLVSANRFVAALGGLLAAAAGAWFIVGVSLADLLHIGSVGTPIGARPGIQSLESLALFYGLGGVVLMLAVFVLGRLTVRGVARERRAVGAVVAASQPVAPAPMERSRVRATATPAPAP